MSNHKREIERKFLVDTERLPELRGGARLVQGYLSLAPTVRVRTEDDGAGERRAYLTIKGSGLVSRDEFEYPIPPSDAEVLLKLCHGSLISKTRYRLPVEGSADLTWEIDVFDGENEGLVVAEVELPGEDTPFERPEWIGWDVTEDPQYKNVALATRPYRRW